MEQYYNTPITINEVAQAIYTNRSYLSKIFKENYHVTIKEFLTNLRLTKACDYLLDTDMPVNKISEIVGFNSYVNFYKAFIKRYIRSPKDYRFEFNDNNKKLSKTKYED